MTLFMHPNWSNSVPVLGGDLVHTAIVHTTGTKILSTGHSTEIITLHAF